LAAIPFSQTRLQEHLIGRRKICLAIAKGTVILFLLGLIADGFPNYHLALLHA
jgi:hypothetical protein